jgi:hypothetical protein
VPRLPESRKRQVFQTALVYLLRDQTELLNQLYLELKGEMAAAALKGLPVRAEPRERFFRVWQNWTNWAVTFPENGQVLAQLSVSGEITAQSRAAGHKMMADLAELAVPVQMRLLRLWLPSAASPAVVSSK